MFKSFSDEPDLTKEEIYSAVNIMGLPQFPFLLTLVVVPGAASKSIINIFSKIKALPALSKLEVENNDA